jgi:hypothetical protein
MKICGCQNCKNRGERNPYEDFELYCSTKELEDNAVFEAIFKASYTIGEMEDLYKELEPQFNSSSVVNRINAYSTKGKPFDAYEYWRGYSGF